MEAVESTAQQIISCLKNNSGSLNAVQVQEATGLALGVVLATLVSLEYDEKIVLTDSVPVNYYNFR
ncbi:MAG TPA: hypothetical protein VLG40_00175 [Candidatus Saccharimonas sp.]|nr:hypothetical protein [Candidatus Saccharimonas sp.]